MVVFKNFDLRVFFYCFRVFCHCRLKTELLPAPEYCSEEYRNSFDDEDEEDAERERNNTDDVEDEVGALLSLVLLRYLFL